VTVADPHASVADFRLAVEAPAARSSAAPVSSPACPPASTAPNLERRRAKSRRARGIDRRRLRGCRVGEDGDADHAATGGRETSHGSIAAVSCWCARDAGQASRRHPERVSPLVVGFRRRVSHARDGLQRREQRKGKTDRGDRLRRLVRLL
jgi:hypothetical protein